MKVLPGFESLSLRQYTLKKNAKFVRNLAHLSPVSLGQNMRDTAHIEAEIAPRTSFFA